MPLLKKEAEDTTSDITKSSLNDKYGFKSFSFRNNNLGVYDSTIMNNLFKKSVEPSNINSIDLLFDGDNMTIFENEITQSGDTINRQSTVFPAYSGTNRNRVDKEWQQTNKKGTIPEGNYWINLSELKYNDNNNYWYLPKSMEKKLSESRRGLWPGGESAWGKARIDIHPKEVKVENTIRGGFTIHGGKYPGSSGCIDLVEKEMDFFNHLKNKHKNKIDRINLIVDYSKKRERLRNKEK